ncbi:hypothetical protein J2Y58_000864 [Sphingomonas sp. BE138]|nr:hypothetical protein [Sphingomonas sp. BE138]
MAAAFPTYVIYPKVPAFLAGTIGRVMALDKPARMFTPSEQSEATENLSRAKAYGRPRRVWVEDGHVFVEGYDGEIVFMLPEVAITMGRELGEAGTASLINRVMDDNDPASPQ